jgi:hypothetical protein
MHMPLSSVECLILSYERSPSDLLGGLYAKLSTLHKVASWGTNADFFIQVEFTPNFFITSTAVEVDPNHESPPTQHPFGIFAPSTKCNTSAVLVVISY